MSGRFQCSCSRCGREKGDRDSNSGWWEMKPRGPHQRTTHFFCPECSATLLVAVDGALEGRKVDGQRVVPIWLLVRAAELLESIDRRRPPASARAVIVHGIDVARLKQLVGELRAIVPPLVPAEAETEKTTVTVIRTPD